MTCANFQVLEPGLGAATATVFTPAEITFPYDSTDDLRLDIYNYQDQAWVNVPFATGATINVGGAGDRFYAWNLTTTNGQTGVTTILATAGTTPALPAGETASHPLAAANNIFPVQGGVGANVRLYRQTSIDAGELPAYFYPGASIRAEDLNDNFEALRKVVEEGSCASNSVSNAQPQLDQRYWNKLDDTLEAGDAWVSDDAHIATTSAGDARWLNATGGAVQGRDMITATETGGNVLLDVDLAANGGLESTNPGNAAGELRVDDGNGIVVNATGVNVGAGTGITVNADDVAVTQVNLWGRPHDHSGNVSGNMSDVGNITFSAGNRSLTTGATTNDLTIAGGTGASDGALIVNRDLELANAATTQLGGVTYTWPGSDAAAANRVLASNGSGSLSWISMTTGGAGAESVFTAANVAALNALAAQTGDDAMNNGDLVLVVDSTDIDDTSVTDPDVQDLPTGDDAPTAWDNTVLTTVQWDGTDSDWNFIRYASATPDGRYVKLESGNAEQTINSGTSAANLELLSSATGATGPTLTFRQNSASPADNDTVGLIAFEGNDSGGTNTEYARLSAIASDVTNNSEAGAITFTTRNGANFTEKMRLTSLGNLFLNSVNNIGFHNITSGNWVGKLQVAQPEQNALASFSLWDDTNATYRTFGGATINIGASRSGTVGTHTALNDQDIIGSFTFSPSDGTNFRNAVRVQAKVDGALSNTASPGALEILTTPANSQTPAQRIRFNSDGNILIPGNQIVKQLTATNLTPRFEIRGTDWNSTTAAITRVTDDAAPPTFILAKARGANQDAHGAVQANDVLGTLQWAYGDGNDLSNTAGRIYNLALSNATSNSLNTGLFFRTSAGVNEKLAMKMNHLGQVVINPLNNTVGTTESTFPTNAQLHVYSALSSSPARTPAMFEDRSTGDSEMYGAVAIRRNARQEPSTELTGAGVGIGFQLQNSNSTSFQEYAYIGGGIITNNNGTQHGALVLSTRRAGVRTRQVTINQNGKVFLEGTDAGIQFGTDNTPGNADSKTLDDYEEGTWTPNLSDHFWWRWQLSNSYYS